ncbi:MULTISPECIES: DJ-1/PfpI family protein [Sphingomonas]|jgi:cyclohexyl-isocyanide hydratase|uniref:DJ-1/PfpI family protein n=1 Tax=Sphingomonas TaxID=13687 RepID=UPI0007023338|nr:MULTISPECIES: DJ-1/PfpI family protein [Sphingomonas]RZM30784.1 MAG: DJ-1/PfpI family protein [Sphingomonas sp.]KQM91117.1 thiamine biosynthesis protein ThiJ [Sphingomonas sp. Leaf226]MBD8641242.1 DJ-1/PfpI family protein [Sphingomonas sp. CFBP 13733]MDY0966464.1 DJ-1/PfpI family protein [Sphingomonas sp. CFBP9021]USR00182.1 DJ-1/PfpI family protein [Sphingomonas aerolata]
MRDPLRIAFLLFPNVTQLDLTGPAQILSRLGEAQVDLVWKTRDPVPTDAGFSILPTAIFAEVPYADILCVPGGFGLNDVIADDEAMAWVGAVGAGATWVTSVCTGSLILGAAGLLDGYRAGCHWAQRDMLPLFGAIPVDARTVVDRNRVTGGGVTAGIDFALTLIALIRGEAHARMVQLALEYDPQPPFDSGSPAQAGPEIVAAYQRRVQALAPTRDEDLRALARRRGYG